MSCVLTARTVHIRVQNWDIDSKIYISDRRFYYNLPGDGAVWLGTYGCCGQTHGKRGTFLILF